MALSLFQFLSGQKEPASLLPLFLRLGPWHAGGKPKRPLRAAKPRVGVEKTPKLVDHRTGELEQTIDYKGHGFWRSVLTQRACLRAEDRCRVPQPVVCKEEQDAGFAICYGWLFQVINAFSNSTEHRLKRDNSRKGLLLWEGLSCSIFPTFFPSTSVHDSQGCPKRESHCGEVGQNPEGRDSIMFWLEALRGSTVG